MFQIEKIMDEEATHDTRFKKHLKNRYGADAVYLFGAIGGLFSFFLIMLFIFCCMILGITNMDNSTNTKIIRVGVEEI